MFESIKDKCKEIISKNEEIVDILLFGSYTRGSDFHDIDLFLVHTINNIDTEMTLIEKVKSFFAESVHITSANIKNIFEGDTIWKTLFHEGYSIKNQKKMSEIFDLHSHVLFTFDLGGLDKTTKTKFSHALNGRGDLKGLVKSLNCKRLGKNALYVTIEKYGEVRDFFEEWKVNYNEKRIWI